MYESKKQSAQRTIEKKDSKLQEIETVRSSFNLASPQTSFGVRSSRIHFSPTKWMRDERTPKDVCGEVTFNFVFDCNILRVVKFFSIYNVHAVTWYLYML